MESETGGSIKSAKSAPSAKQRGPSPLVKLLICGALLYFTYDVGSAIWRSIRNSGQERKLQEVRAAGEDAMRRAGAGETGQALADAMNKQAVAVKQLAETVDGSEGIFLKCATKLSERVTVLAAAKQAGVEWMKPGGLFVKANLDTPEHLQSSRARVLRLDEISQQIMELTKSFPQDIRACLRENQYPAALLDKAISDMNLQTDATSRIQELDHLMFSEMITMLDLLARIYPKYQFETDGTLSFTESGQDLDQFNAHYSAIQRFSAEQLELQRKVVAAHTTSK